MIDRDKITRLVEEQNAHLRESLCNILLEEEAETVYKYKWYLYVTLSVWGDSVTKLMALRTNNTEVT